VTGRLEEFMVAGDNKAVLVVRLCQEGDCGHWYHVVTMRRDKIVCIEDHVSRDSALSSIGRN
jgi:hypothetical protein